MRVIRRYGLSAAMYVSLAACSPSEPDPTSPQGPRTPRALEARRISAGSPVGGTQYYSSTHLNIAWEAPSGGAEYYRVTWTEAGAASGRSVEVLIGPLGLIDLKASTSYGIQVAACSGVVCHAADAASINVETPAEVWHLQGTGGSIAGLTRIVPDGNVKLHVLRYGAGAPADLLGRIRLYYGPLPQNAKGLAPALTSSAASSDVSSFASFTSSAGTGGFLNPASAAPLVGDVATGQGVALASPLGERIRLYFEARGADGRTRIMSVDASDGYVGRDFNSGPSTVCSTQTDYSPGGGCAPTVAIGVEGDAVAPNARIANARQFKIGVPTQTDWRWNGAPGTFMVFTTDHVPGCSTVTPNQGYAVWSGTAWDVQYEPSGCPKLFRSMQAAHPLHLRDMRFKLYYGDPSDQTGRVPGSMLPFLGPKKMLYADGARTGDPLRVDYDDWEPTGAGRRLVFLWPNGALLNATALGYIDDFSVVLPTNNPALQVMYVAVTDGAIAPFAGVAVLVNP